MFLILLIMHIIFLLSKFEKMNKVDKGTRSNSGILIMGEKTMITKIPDIARRHAE